jgi:hypothetical protein
MGMTLEEVNVLKVQLEEGVGALVQLFETETGLEVTELFLGRQDATDLGGAKRSIFTGICAEVRMK